MACNNSAGCLRLTNSIAATAGIRGRESICEAYSRSSAGVASRSTGTTSRKLFRPLESVKAPGDSDQPTMIIAHTTKGKGVHFTEGKHEWHSKVATKEELRESSPRSLALRRQ